MKQRHLYVLLFSVPALVAALLAGFIVLAGAAGFMWLFVYGDDPWPRAAEGTLVVLFLFVSGTTWAVLLRRAWREGDQHEQAGAPPRVGRLAIAAAGITAVLLILVGLHQWNVGNIGPRTDSVACSDFCAARGFAGSSMPPKNAGARTCTCIDATGRDAITVPLADAAAGRP